jgi:large subunit ribosomal protein L10
MDKEQKSAAIAELAEELKAAPVFYLADASSLNVETINNLRKACYKSKVKMKVVKNTLLKKAMERLEGTDLSEMYSVLHGPTAILYAETGNAPARVIKEFRKKSDRPVLKAAYVEETIYIGDNQLTALSNIKSKNELVADIVALLQSPAKNVISALKSSGGNKIAGLVKALETRNA